jgi:hypothetical protein
MRRSSQTSMTSKRRPPPRSRTTLRPGAISSYSRGPQEDSADNASAHHAQSARRHRQLDGRLVAHVVAVDLHGHGPAVD